MNYLKYDILNNYLDNELTAKESETVQKSLNESARDKARFIELKKIDEGLREMSPINISQKFTSSFMDMLHLRTMRIKKQKHFMIYIYSFLSTTVIAFSGIAFYKIITKYLENTVGSTILNKLSYNLSILTESIKNSFVFENYSCLWISSSFIMVILLYFLIDEIKLSIHRLNCHS